MLSYLIVGLGCLRMGLRLVLGFVVRGFVIGIREFGNRRLVGLLYSF